VIGGALKIRRPIGYEFGVVIAVNQAQGLFVGLMDDGRYVEFRLPKGTRFAGPGLADPAPVGRRPD
jgi:hypothetical protein